ncbi:hypothetical protein EDD16DRAFT_1554361 [Pisolithus croceorrhizus]|nr:hypothetical protein EV401DRAFT_1997018 [Pisolithus croceorrhizus]KAI6126366.1 hypothetical protein EDD16DRAFT_1554361 [Pisolithus croceorrhizus]KAI6167681.1 hypothetical protein EDD17DRAFT_1534024 [Pisolithus thermaeus]
MSMVATLSLSMFWSCLHLCLLQARKGSCPFTSNPMRLPLTNLLELNWVLSFRVAHLLSGWLLALECFSLPWYLFGCHALSHLFFPLTLS